ncbi:helix-turn-helix domain-containing protein [Neobacillus sp. DY30]|uniref:helix-turn-helix domain-containing protein n=1 Tax=Neobacillus sp. DY30 TaxID=3047871 RepID=UPI0024C0CF81|nr:helix-turn-helix domain-containing protein [Neobacillus sp. DY30]WHY01356.1 helix-turn-helix domain-containing protein [Neobacillus sp. DY30]
MNEVAEILGVSRDRAYALVRKGILPAVYLGRQIRIEPEQLSNWISKGGKANE